VCTGITIKLSGGKWIYSASDMADVSEKLNLFRSREEEPANILISQLNSKF
jgi:hypothetical protein